LISLHPKNTIFPTFLGQTPHFLGKKPKTRTNNLPQRKVFSVAVFFNPKVEGSSFIKNGAILFISRWVPNIPLFLARPPRNNPQEAE
jgi:hypothetical protein